MLVMIGDVDEQCEQLALLSLQSLWRLWLRPGSSRTLSAIVLGKTIADCSENVQRSEERSKMARDIEFDLDHPCELFVHLHNLRRKVTADLSNSDEQIICSLA